MIQHIKQNVITIASLACWTTNGILSSVSPF